MSRNAVPWSWLSDGAGLYRSLIPALVEWEAVTEIELDQTKIKRALAMAIDENATWLRHPCLARLSNPRSAAPFQADLHLVAWTACNTEEEFGNVTLAREAWLWTPSQVIQVPAGRHSLDALGVAMRDAAPVPIPLDIWCQTVGFTIEDTWATTNTLDQGQESQLHREIIEYCRTIRLLNELLPDVFHWVSVATQVVIPMRKKGTDLVHSGSQANLFGLVYTDLHGGRAQIVETVIHETAHNHLYAIEAFQPLVDPSHKGKYHSPLRPEPRPLRGILLAYHALSYICAAFVDAVQASYLAARDIEKVFADLCARRDEAEDTLNSNKQHITEAGLHFLNLTTGVARYGEAL
jgi:HEXXH motif-containing protein